MRDRSGEMEIIEVLTPDDPVWGPDDGAATAAPPARHRTRRRTALVTGLVIAAVAAAGLALFPDGDSDSASDAAAQASTTLAAATTAPARLTPSAAAQPAVAHFVIDDPALRPYSADVVTAPPPDASFTLWASGDATTPWLMLQVARDRPPFVFTDSSRRLAGGFELVSRRGQLSTTDVVIDIGGRWTASIRAFGIDDDALTRFASGLQLVDGLVVVDDAVTEQLGLSVTHTDQWAAQLLYGTVTSEMRSLTAQGTTITLRAAPGALDERRALLPFFTTGLVGGADRYTTGTLVATGEAIVIWATDGHLLSLTGATTPHRLLSIARSVRRAGAREWQQLLYGLHPDYRLGEFAEVARAGTGTDDSGAWKAGLQLAQRDGRTEYLWWWTWPDAPDISSSISAGRDLAGALTIETIVVRGATYVFVAAPTASAPNGAVVQAADGTATELRLSQPFPNVPVLVGVARIDTTGPVEVVIRTSE